MLCGMRMRPKTSPHRICPRCALPLPLQNLTSHVVGQRQPLACLAACNVVPVLLEVARGGGLSSQEGVLKALGNLATEEDACHEAMVRERQPWGCGMGGAAVQSQSSLLPRQ